jgi:flagellar basal body-associated protein FliL
MPAKKSENSTKKMSNKKKAVIIIAITIAALLTIGSALAYYNFVNDNLLRPRPLKDRPMMRGMMNRRTNAGQMSRKLIRGQVISNADNVINLSANDGDWQVNLSDSTKYRLDGKDITKDDIKVNDQISVFGKKDTNNHSIDATLIRKTNL